MIGWDEIASANIDSTSISQYWSNGKNAEKAIKRGMKVILSPAKKTYLDMQYDTLSKHVIGLQRYQKVKKHQSQKKRLVCVNFFPKSQKMDDNANC